jgi:hypothetical protein
MRIKRFNESFDDNTSYTSLDEFLEDILIYFEDNKYTYDVENAYINEKGGTNKSIKSGYKECTRVIISTDNINTGNLVSGSKTVDIDKYNNFIIQIKQVKNRLVGKGYNVDILIYPMSVNIYITDSNVDYTKESLIGDDFNLLYEYQKFYRESFNPRSVKLDGDRIILHTFENHYTTTGKKREINMNSIIGWTRKAKVDLSKYNISNEYGDDINGHKTINWILTLK